MHCLHNAALFVSVSIFQRCQHPSRRSSSGPSILSYVSYMFAKFAKDSKFGTPAVFAHHRSPITAVSSAHQSCRGT